MKIKSCHIDNFGKMQDFDYICSNDNLNIIKEDNSWGKTTFSVFLKSMFYGLEYNSKKINERKQYEPWQGGMFGGSLIIEVEDREYRIERSFGKKDKEDTFRIIDLYTGKETDRYSENLGEELFKIDRESFEKSIFIPQCKIETGMTDRFNAKIGNLTQIKDDISNYEIVKKALEEKKKEYNSRSKKSIISQYNEELKQLKNKEQNRINILESTKLIEKHLDEKKLKLNKLQNEKTFLNEKLVGQSKNAEQVALYKNAVENLKHTEEKIKCIENKYKGKEIKEKDIQELKEERDNIKGLVEQLKILEVNEEDVNEYKKYKAMFKEKIPTKEFMDKVKEYIDKLKSLAIHLEKERKAESSDVRLAELQSFFNEKSTTDEEILKQLDNYQNSEALKKDILSCEIELNNISENHNEKHISLTSYITIGILVMSLGVALAVLLEPFFIAIAGIGMAIFMLGIVKTKKNRAVDERNSEAKMRLYAELELKKKKCQEAEQEYKDFIRCFRVRYSENVMEVLLEIRDQYTEYVRLQQENLKTKKNVEIYQSEYNNIQRKLNEMLNINSGENAEKVYQELLYGISQYSYLQERMEKYQSVEYRLNVRRQAYKETISEYGDETLSLEGLESDYKELLREKKSFKELQLQITRLGEHIKTYEGEEILSVIDIKEKIAECDSMIQILSDDIARHERDVESNYVLLEETEDIDNEILQKKRQIAESKEKYEMLDMTLSYIQMAKEKFSARYLGPMRKSFAKYVTFVNGVDAPAIKTENMEIDIDLIPTLNYGSLGKSKDSLSQGYRDLVDLCIRCALIDTMYENERPILIFDDPFVNLDEAKIENAIELLRQISQKYQIIYFTCHNSRM